MQCGRVIWLALATLFILGGTLSWLSPPAAAEPVIETIVPSPANEGENVTFTGNVSGPEGNVTAYQWRSDLDGLFGTDKRVTLNNLSRGNHTIFFKVQYENGTWSEETTARLHINGRPNASIISVDSQNTSGGQSVTLQGLGFDPEGTPVEFYWVSNIDGFLGNGSRLTIGNLTPGDHTLYLQVRDLEGAWSPEDRINLHINALPTAAIAAIEPSPAREGESVTFQALASDPDGNLTTYEWVSSLDGPFGSNATVTTSNLSAGHHTIYLRVQDNEGAWSLPVEANLIVSSSKCKGCLDSGPAIRLTTGAMAALGGAVLFLVGMATYAHADETARYRLSYTLAPLTTQRRRRRSDDPLAHETRAMIKGALLMNPGAHYSLLKERLKLNNGTLAHHLRVMEREELVVSRKLGHLRCFYLAGGEAAPEGREAPLTGMQEQLLKAVRDRPRSSQKGLAQVLGVTPAAVKYQADKLIASGRLRRVREGLTVRYEVEPDRGKGQ